jgi:HEAT repeat protein
VSTTELIARLGSGDADERAMALAALVGQGGRAAPALAEALDDPDERVRAQAARALAEIADPRTADRLAAATEDASPDVRGRAAVGLARIGDPRAIDALVRTIGDVPDPLHHPSSAGVAALVEVGPPALPAVAPLLTAEDPTTRQRAFLVLTSVVSGMGEDWRSLWEANGRYDPNGDAADREAAAARWTGWIRALSPRG